jgi:hypothetical protein
VPPTGFLPVLFNKRAKVRMAQQISIGHPGDS